jgi:dTDP-glucose 4,6-dehydratase
MSKAEVLVTGAGGFIGSHVVELLLQSRYRVRALVHYNSLDRRGHLQNIGARVSRGLTVIAGDVTDAHYVESAAEGCQIILHLAALIGIPYSYDAPASYVATNIHGTLNILEASRKLKTKRVVITSTSEVYGSARFTPITEDHPLQAQSPYAATKIAADKLAQSYFNSFDLPVVTLRPFNTYGPRQSARAVIPTILVQALSGAKEIRLGNLHPKRDLTYVTDTARAFLLAAVTPGLEGETIHFGQGSAVSVGDLARGCIAVARSRARIAVDQRRKRPRLSEVDVLLSDPSKARKLLNWSPEVPLDEGLDRTARYVRDHLSDYRSGYVV